MNFASHGMQVSVTALVAGSISDSFASGVCLAVEKPLPRSPQVCPPKLKHRRLDDTEFCPIAQNYPSARSQ